MNRIFFSVYAYGLAAGVLYILFRLSQYDLTTFAPPPHSLEALFQHSFSYFWWVYALTGLFFLGGLLYPYIHSTGWAPLIRHASMLLSVIPIAYLAFFLFGHALGFWIYDDLIGLAWPLVASLFLLPTYYRLFYIVFSFLNRMRFMRDPQG